MMEDAGISVGSLPKPRTKKQGRGTRSDIDVAEPSRHPAQSPRGSKPKLPKVKPGAIPPTLPMSPGSGQKQ